MKSYLEFIRENYSFETGTYNEEGKISSDKIEDSKIEDFIESIKDKSYLHLKNDMGLCGNFYCEHIQEIDNYIKEGIYRISSIWCRKVYDEDPWVLMNLQSTDNNIITMVLPIEEYEYDGNFEYLNSEEVKNVFNSERGINKFKL